MQTGRFRTRKEAALIKNRMVTIIGALLTTLALFGTAVAVGSASGAGRAQTSQDTQEKKDTGGDKRGQALSKYLEAKRLEEASNYSGAVAAYKEAIELDPKSVEFESRSDRFT